MKLMALIFGCFLVILIVLIIIELMDIFGNLRNKFFSMPIRLGWSFKFGWTGYENKGSENCLLCKKKRKVCRCLPIHDKDSENFCK